MEQRLACAQLVHDRVHFSGEQLTCQVGVPERGQTHTQGKTNEWEFGTSIAEVSSTGVWTYDVQLYKINLPNKMQCTAKNSAHSYR